jgi:hypothetical protein
MPARKNGLVAFSSATVVTAQNSLAAARFSACAARAASEALPGSTERAKRAFAKV